MGNAFLKVWDFLKRESVWVYAALMAGIVGWEISRGNWLFAGVDAAIAACFILLSLAVRSRNRRSMEYEVKMTFEGGEMEAIRKAGMEPVPILEAIRKAGMEPVPIPGEWHDPSNCIYCKEFNG